MEMIIAVCYVDQLLKKQFSIFSLIVPSVCNAGTLWASPGSIVCPSLT
uniref:Uncharacterized protein n=1 Tax=Arundo donax TaxID=35708 RepID=A0A0A9HDS7_ARUDO